MAWDAAHAEEAKRAALKVSREKNLSLAWDAAHKEELARNKAKAKLQASADKSTADKAQQDLGRAAYQRVRGQVLDLPSHEQTPVRDYLRARTSKNGEIAQELQQQHLDRDTAARNNDTAAVARHNAEIKHLNETHKREVSDLSLVNRELTGHVGLLHQAGLAAQQFLRYAILYGAGFKVLSGIGATIAGAFALDKALHNIKAITQASKEGMTVIEESIKRVASGSEFSVAEISQAAQVLAQAGVELNKLPSILAITAKLASTTSSDLKSTADIITSLTDVFEKSSAIEVNGLADQVAQAVNISKLSVESLKTITSLGASTAKLSGVKSEQLLGYSATLSNKGVKDSTIATGLREMMVELFSPDAKTLAFLKQRYAKINEHLSEEVIKSKFQAYHTADDPIRAALLELKRLGVAGSGRNEFSRVTETRAQNVLLPLLDSLEKSAGDIAKISQGGAIDRGAATNKDAFNNSVNGLSSSLTALSHELMEGFLPGLVSAVKVLTSFTEKARENTINANGESANSVPRSIGAGLIAGGLAFAKTPGGLVKRSMAAVGAGTAFSSADSLAQTQGTSGKAIAAAADIAITMASLAGIWSAIRTKAAVVGPSVSAAATASAFIQKGFAAILLLFQGTHWGRLAALATVATGAVASAYAAFRGDDGQARLQAARTRQTNNQARKDELDAAFAPFNKETEGGQAAIIHKAGKDFADAKKKIGDTLGLPIIPPKVLEGLIELGTKGIEAGSAAQTEALDKIRKLVSLPDSQVKDLTEAGAKLAANQEIIVSKVQQQSEELSAAMEAIDPTPVQKAMLAVYGRLSAGEQKLLTVASKSKSSAQFEAAQKASANFLELVFKELPTDAADKLEVSRASIAALLTQSGETNKDELEKAVLSLRESANKGMVDYLLEVKNQLAAEFDKGKSTAAMQRLSQTVREVLPVAQEIKGIEEQNKRDAEKAKADAAARQAEHDRIQAEYGAKQTDAEQNELRYKLSSSGKSLDLTEGIRKATETQDLGAARELSAQLAGIQQKEADLKLATATAKFEKEYLLNPPYSSIKETPTSGVGYLSRTQNVADRAELYATEKEFRDAALNGTPDLKKALEELVQAHGEATIKVPGAASATDAGYQHQITNKDISDQQAANQFDIQDNQRKVEGARRGHYLAEQAESLMKEREALDKRALELRRAELIEAKTDSNNIEAELKAMSTRDADARQNILNEGKHISLTGQKSALAAELKTIDKTLSHAVDTGNFPELAEIQKRRIAVATKLLEAEVALLDSEKGFASDEEKRRFIADTQANIQFKAVEDIAKTLDNQAELYQKQYRTLAKESLFGNRQAAFNDVTGRTPTRDQQVQLDQYNLSNAYDVRQKLQGTLSTQESFLSKVKPNSDEALLFAKDIEKTKQAILNIDRVIGQFEGEIDSLTQTFVRSMLEVSDQGVIREFEKLNPGFTHLRQQVETNLAETLDGLTGIIGDFISHGFSAVQDIEGLRDAMMNTAQAQGNYMSTVSNRAGILSEIQSSPTILKESQAVQTLIIQQATTAQQAAEAAARQQLAIAKLQEAQVRKENSLGGQIQKYMADSMKELGSTFLKDAMGEGISSLFGLSPKSATVMPDGSQMVYVTNMGEGMATGGVDPKNPSGPTGLMDSLYSGANKAYGYVSNGVSSAFDSVSSFFGGSSPTSAGSEGQTDASASAAAASLKTLGDTAASSADQLSTLGVESGSSASKVTSLASMIATAFQTTSVATEVDSAAVQANAMAMQQNTAATAANAASKAAGGGGRWRWRRHDGHVPTILQHGWIFSWWICRWRRVPR